MLSETLSQSSGSVFLAVMLWVKMYFLRTYTMQHGDICDKSVRNSIPITYVLILCQGNAWVESLLHLELFSKSYSNFKVHILNLHICTLQGDQVFTRASTFHLFSTNSMSSACRWDHCIVGLSGDICIELLIRLRRAKLCVRYV